MTIDLATLDLFTPEENAAHERRKAVWAAASPAERELIRAAEAAAEAFRAGQAAVRRAVAELRRIEAALPNDYAAFTQADFAAINAAEAAIDNARDALGPLAVADFRATSALIDFDASRAGGAL